MTKQAIEARGLSVDRGAETVLRNINFHVAEGEVFALLGGNGAGKSTTLLTLLGILKPKSGQAIVLGQDVHTNVSDIRAKVAYLPEAATLYPHLSAVENIEYFLSLAEVPSSSASIDAVLEQVALDASARHRRLEHYSKGMRQKTAIALALLRDTPILLLDEPTSGLDPVAIDEFNRLVSELAASGRTVLMVTHDVYGACQVANRIGLLRHGELVGEFSSKDGQQIDTETVHAAFSERGAA